MHRMKTCSNDQNGCGSRLLPAFFGNTAMVPVDRRHRWCCSDRAGGTNHQLRPRKKLSRNERATESPQLTKEVFRFERYSSAKTRTGTVHKKSRLLDRTIFQKPCPLQQYLPRAGEPPLAKQYALPHRCEGLQDQVPCQSMTGRRFRSQCISGSNL
jgi:hypothetical protein